MARGAGGRRTGGRDGNRGRTLRRGASGGGFFETLFGSGGRTREPRRERQRFERPSESGPSAAQRSVTEPAVGRSQKSDKPGSQRWDVPQRKVNLLFVFGGLAFVMLLMVVVLPLKLTVPVGVNVPAGKVCVPPLSVTVPAPFSDEPGA